MKTKKIQKQYIDHGLGFPVKILNAPFVKIRGEWALDIDFKKYKKKVLLSLSTKPVRLSGNEVRFIRHYFEMSLKNFGKKFGDVAHSAVIKWEKHGDDTSCMGWAIEKDIRLAIVDHINPRFLQKTYRGLQGLISKRRQKISIDISDLRKTA